MTELTIIGELSSGRVAHRVCCWGTGAVIWLDARDPNSAGCGSEAGPLGDAGCRRGLVIA